MYSQCMAAVSDAKISVFEIIEVQIIYLSKSCFSLKTVI